MKKYIIYITTNLINGKKYIGSHITENIDDDYLGSGVYINKSITKYGRTNFIREILAIVDNKENMKELEEYYIDYYQSFTSPMFYNATKHAAGITNNTWGDKVSKALKGHKYNLGKVCSEETKLKISKANTGIIFTQEHKDKIGKSKLGNSYALGNKLSKEVCRSISEAKIGHVCYENPERGNKIRDKNSKSIAQYSLKGEFIQEYNSATQASISLGGVPSNISQCLNNRTKSAYGFIWKFKNL
jgi:group I intron endonuclease